MSTHLRPTGVPGLSLRELAAALGDVTSSGPSTDPAITGATLDSRQVLPGDLYAALPGAHVHGARFAASAAQSGAAAVLTDEAGRAMIDEAGVDVPLLVVDDPRAVLGGLAALVYGRPADALTTIGITGTNGKTTTAYIIDTALRAAGHVTGLVGTIETRVGDERVTSVRTTPESPDVHGLLALMRERGVDACTMEVSSHALALHRVDGVRYDVAVFTNLSQDHLDFHHTMEEYFAAKASLFTPARSARGIVCVDDEWGQRLVSRSEVPVVSLATGTSRSADWHLLAEPGSPPFVLRARDGGEEMHLRSALPGDFNRTNTALAALTLRELGFGVEQVRQALAADVTVPGRAQRVDLGPGAPLAVVDFAHTPDAVGAVLAAMRDQVPGRIVAVLGAGGRRDPGKRPAMGARAAASADEVVVTDDNPRDEDPATIRAAVLQGALDAGADPERCRQVAGRDAAIETALGLAGSHGLVAVLGKGHETGQEIDGVVHPHDDREALAQAWARRRARTAERTQP